MTTSVSFEQFRIAPCAAAERLRREVRRDDPTRAARPRHRPRRAHLLRLVRDYVRFYNDDRLHMELGGDARAGRAIEGPDGGDVVALPRVGGLHHRYSRAA